MNSILPFDVFLSKKARPAVWERVLPKSLADYLSPNGSTYYLGLKRTRHLVAKQLFSDHLIAWTKHFITRKAPCNCFIKSRDRHIIFYYVVKGTIEYRTSRDQHIAVRGYMNMISAIDHEFIAKENSELFFLFIPAEILERYRYTFPPVAPLLSWSKDQNLLTLCERDIKDDGRAANLINQLTMATNTTVAPEPSMILEKLLITVLDQMFPIPKHVWIPSPCIEAVQAVRTAILDNLSNGRPPALQKVSRMVGLNARKLETVFKQYYGTTMLDFYQTARMEAIYRALSDRNKPLREIADNFNYEDYSTFSAAVKRKWGKGPRGIRYDLLIAQKQHEGTWPVNSVAS
ncbi:AraC family transcriptional regulator [Chitinophaga sp. S165]|uniref:helix-turn-helix domain-containing protein n=1 Tax=Chitinophaga sp. S165 TaxID=2135462 RepID=UPI000D715AC4|nr:AraC family transcriptional regulator [Chitinophaga sp. S165]PWV47070.1 AraC-like DNA-binding protein [Chitinophaga sp. S165]